MPWRQFVHGGSDDSIVKLEVFGDAPRAESATLVVTKLCIGYPWGVGRSKGGVVPGGPHVRTSEYGRYIIGLATGPRGTLLLMATLSGLLGGAIGPVGRSVSESGRLRHGDGDQGRGDRRRKAFMLAILRIRLARGRTFGDVWLGWTLWRA